MTWGEGNYKQGYPFEDYMATQLPEGSRLPVNFKTFDFFNNETGVATSVKTIDTQTVSKIKDPKQIYASIKNNVDAVANYKGYTHSNGLELRAKDISQREIVIAIPKATSTQQWEQINKAIVYGAENRVNVKITVVK